MEQRDLIKDQIEQLGKVLAKMLSDFLGFKSNGQMTEGIEATNHALQSQLDLDIEKLTTLTTEELKDYLKHRNLTAEHLEVLSEYLKEAGLSQLELDKNKAGAYLEKAIALLDMADEISKTMSFNRIKKKNEISEQLKMWL